jgi:chromosome segregation ATPase
MSDKSVRELELIIQRLNSQIESKNEQIAELNAFIQTATANTQELIRSFRAFCVKVLESELAYGDITSRDLEMMSLEELLGRSRKMLKQNQEKARSIYDTFKDRLTQKNLMIQGLTDQVSQLKTKLDQRNDEPFEVPDDLKRTPAYLLETDTPLDAIRPAISNTTIAGENERVVSFDEGGTNPPVRVLLKRSCTFRILTL